jgi:hypothetical protein
MGLAHDRASERRDRKGPTAWVFRESTLVTMSKGMRMWDIRVMVTQADRAMPVKNDPTILRWPGQ